MAIIDSFSKEALERIVQESHSYKEVLQKIGYTTFGGRNTDTLKTRLNKYEIDVSHFCIQKGTKRTEENVFCENSTASQSTLRKWFVKGQYVPYKCDCCGITEWQGKELSLQLDHINGDNHDNRLENLHWLCPNCHSQTDTFCGKGTKKNHITSNGVTKKEFKQNYCIECGKEISQAATWCPECAAKQRRIVERPNKEELLQLLLDNNGSFTEVGRMYGVGDNTIRKWCKNYELPTHSTDYKPAKKPKQEPTLPKAVIQLDKNTEEELQAFDSLADAGRWIIDNGYSKSQVASDTAIHIGQVCNGRRKTAYGFKWKLKNN